LCCRISNQIRFEKLARLVSKTNFSVLPLTMNRWICNDSALTCLAWYYRPMLSTMRESRPPVRLFDPVHVVLPRRNVFLKPFAGQPRKYCCPRRLPGLETKISQVPGAGYGLFLREKVYAGQSITLYRRKIVSEATARTLKKKVSPFFDIKPNLELIPKTI